MATAPLGDATYRVVFECKSAGSMVEHAKNRYAAEAARFRDGVGAQYAVVIGPRFPHEPALDDELAKHRVALWTVEDFVTLLESQFAHPA